MASGGMSMAPASWIISIGMLEATTVAPGEGRPKMAVIDVRIRSVKRWLSRASIAPPGTTAHWLSRDKYLRSVVIALIVHKR